MALIERTKVLDTLFVKYGLKMNYIQACAERHALNDDNEIKTLALSY
jgi:hypothetical protein